MSAKENYADLIRSLRICAGVGETGGCEDCIFENDICGSAEKLMIRAACAIEDLSNLYDGLKGEQSK